MTARTPTPSSSITRGAIHSTRDSTTLNFIEMSFVSANDLIRKCVGVTFAIKLRVIFLFIFFDKIAFLTHINSFICKSLNSVLKKQIN